MSFRKLNREESSIALVRMIASTDDLISRISNFNKNIEANGSNKTWGDVGTAAAVRDQIALAAAIQGSISHKEYTEITGKAF